MGAMKNPPVTANLQRRSGGLSVGIAGATASTGAEAMGEKVPSPCPSVPTSLDPRSPRLISGFELNCSRQIMTDKTEDARQEARQAAVRRSQQREADQAQAKADQEAARRAMAKVLEQNRQQWATAYQTIHR